MPSDQFFSYIMARKSLHLDEMMMSIKITARLIGFINASLLKQQSMGRHIAPLGHIILIQSQQVFAFYSLMLHA